jgi:hypothetical protein
MNTRYISLVASLILAVGSGAMAQTAVVRATDQAVAPFNAANAVGHWLHDLQGSTIGSVRALSTDGQTAEIMVGSYFQPGSHVASVPSHALAIVGGKVTLRGETVDALNTAARLDGH